MNRKRFPSLREIKTPREDRQAQYVEKCFMHRRSPCNACWPDDLPMIKFSHCTTPGSNSGSITNNPCGVTQVTQRLRVPGNYCAQCPADKCARS